MAGRPISRARQAAAAERLREREQRSEFAKESVQRMRGRRFEGHDPPMPAKPKPEPGLTPEGDLDFKVLEQAVLGGDKGALNLADLWPLAHEALESILRDPDASAASKVQAARIVQAARAADVAADMAGRDTKIIFETAAYIPPEQ